MEDTMELLESRPLVGFQMDGSHLHNVLKRIIQEQQQQAQFQHEMSLRLCDLEEDLRTMNMRQKEMESLFKSVDSDTLRKMRQQLDYLDESVENMSRDIKESRSLAADAVQVAEDAGRAAQTTGREMGTVRSRIDQMQQDLEELADMMTREHRQLNDTVKSLGREQTEQAEQTQNIFRELEQMNGRENWQKLSDMLDEFSERTDKNFRSVEDSARAVDAELNRLGSDIKSLQTNYESLDDQMRQSLSNVAKDMDTKCDLILGTLREQERSALEIEEHMVAAGQALARRKAMKEQQRASAARAHDNYGTRRNGCITSAAPIMYVGAWQEYKLMKVIENLREENERLRRDAFGSSDGLQSGLTPWGMEWGHGSSHHFPTNVKNDTLGSGGTSVTSDTTNSGRISVPKPPAHPSLRRKASQNTKTTALRLMRTVRDVDVFVEEEANTGKAPLSSSASVGSRSGSDGIVSKRYLSHPSKKLGKHGEGKVCWNNNMDCPDVNTAANVHTEIGTGRILGASQQRPPPPTATNGGPAFLPFFMESPQVRDDPLLKELLRGAPLDTKTKYQQAGQPLLERKAPKSSKNEHGLSDEEVQKRVERRLRLQMLYRGNLPSGEHFSPGTEAFLTDRSDSGTLLQLESVQELKQPTESVFGTGQSFPGVPWDFPVSRPTNTAVEDGVALVQTYNAPSTVVEEKSSMPHRFSSASPSRTRLKHPYDVGAPLAPPTVGLSLPSTNTNTLLRPSSGSSKRVEGFNNQYYSSCSGGNGDGNYNSPGLCADVKSGYSAPNVVNALRPSFTDSVPHAEYPVTAGNLGPLPLPSMDAGATLTSDPIDEDDDMVGMLINWAEQLDPNSIA